MIIRSISLRNYRRFRRVNLELPDGVVAIVGPNGAGKTTLVESIAWALFGNEAEVTRGDKKGILRQGAGKGEKCEVSVVFEIGGREYSIRRQMSASGGITAQLESSGKSLAEGAVPVTAHVSKLLGMDYKAFFASIFARQKELNALSKQTEGERRATVMRLLGVESLDSAIAAARKDHSLAKENLSIVHRQLMDTETGKPALAIRAEEAERMESEIAAKQQELDGLIERLIASREAASRAKERLDRSGEAKKRHDALKERAMSARKDIEEGARNVRRLEVEMEALEADGKALDSMAVGEKRYAAAKRDAETLAALEVRDAERKVLEERAAKAEVEAAKRAKALAALAKELKGADKLEAEHRELERKRKALASEAEKLRDAAAAGRERARALEAAIADLEARNAEIAKLGEGGVCPTCERTLGTHHRELTAKTEKELKAKRTELEKCTKSFEEAGEDLSSLEAQSKALEKRTAAVEKARAALSQKAGRAKALEDEAKAAEARTAADAKRLAKLGEVQFDPKALADLKSELRVLETQHERYVALSKAVESIPEKKKALDSARKSMDAATETVKALAAEIATVGFDEAAHAAAEAEERSSRDVAHGLALEVEKAKGAMTLRKERLERVKAEAKRLRKLESEASAIDARREYLAKTAELLDDFKRHVVGRIGPALAAKTSSLLETLSSGRYSQVEIDEDYSIKVLDDGQAFELERYSGGEEDLVNLCMRLAISQLIAERRGAAGLNMVILDEIFGSQDPERRRSILTALNGLSNTFRQTLLITHTDDVRDSVGAVVLVSSGGDGSASVASLAN
jgi:exonuclease SbcC